MYIKHVIFQSTRPSRASTFQPGSSPGTKKISIHKALAGLDNKNRKGKNLENRFQSTRPSRASTGIKKRYLVCILYFNPQGPRGPRHGLPWWKVAQAIFQSTRPSRASTVYSYEAKPGSEISIHKALAGLDPRIPVRLRISRNFNPQGPRGPRPRSDL